ncbi:hypothetical protein MKW94_004033 [Papaver nudicaule]|uniref:Uncharacterized protein n=1 Tax=Papaver nudicaule TaxID=74823 RepID=A0AA42AQ75_PAPNU|nr:hypothetical protein [Papaver nudicaule]
MLDTVEEFNHNNVIEEFDALTKDAGKVQKETLRRILEENSKAEYLLQCGLDGRTDPESFKKCIPLADHKDLEPYIQRIADGDTGPVLTGKPLTAISLSSGTTQGKPKFVPFNNELVKITMQMYRTSFAFRNREIPAGKGRALQFIYSSKQFKTKGGLSASTATTNIYRSTEFKNTMKALKSQCCSPDEVIFGPDFHESLYCHLLCGLIYRDEVQIVSSTFAHSIVHAFREFEEVWEDLCSDIRAGVLSDRVTTPSVRIAISRILRPNPELADLLHDTCSNLSNWYGLIPELFPNAKYIYGIMTGTMLPYLKKLRHYAGKLPLCSADYGSSEGWIAANVNPRLPPESATFAVLPDIAYFEFMPLSGDVENAGFDSTAANFVYVEAEPVGLTEVKIGEEYEIILTTYAGLYRYRLGDVVKVTGFYNSTPELQFICRRSLLLTINIDKNTEKDLQIAVEAASQRLMEEKIELIDYSSHADMTTDPGHYVIFWELSREADDDEVMNECCNCLDKSFVDAGYIGSRKVKAIGDLELRILKRGTFHKILDHYLGLGAAVSQFKTPRFVGPMNNTVLQILCNNVAKSYVSTAYG